MKRFILVITLASLPLLAGCNCLVRNTTVKQARPAVKAAYESSRDTEKNWDAYNSEQQKRFMKLNTQAWADMNRILNPPPPKE